MNKKKLQELFRNVSILNNEKNTKSLDRNKKYLSRHSSCSEILTTSFLEDDEISPNISHEISQQNNQLQKILAGDPKYKIRGYRKIQGYDIKKIDSEKEGSKRGLLLVNKDEQKQYMLPLFDEKNMNIESSIRKLFKRCKLHAIHDQETDEEGCKIAKKMCLKKLYMLNR